MRNKNRIPQILKRIQHIWERNLDLRLGQLICNIIDPKYLYEIEDEKLLELMEKIYVD